MPCSVSQHFDVFWMMSTLSFYPSRPLYLRELTLSKETVKFWACHKPLYKQRDATARSVTYITDEDHPFHNLTWQDKAKFAQNQWRDCKSVADNHMAAESPLFITKSLLCQRQQSIFVWVYHHLVAITHFWTTGVKEDCKQYMYWKKLPFLFIFIQFNPDENPRRSDRSIYGDFQMFLNLSTSG